MILSYLIELQTYCNKDKQRMDREAQHAQAQIGRENAPPPGGMSRETSGGECPDTRAELQVCTCNGYDFCHHG